jgi:hypothetical protein
MMKLYFLSSYPTRWQEIINYAIEYSHQDIQCISSANYIQPDDFVMLDFAQNIPRCKLIGNRIYNRLDRMYLMESLGVRTIKWSTLNNISILFQEWNTDVIVYKSDFSYQGKYVDLIYQNMALPKYAKADKDILMEFVGDDQPQVLKVYFCHDQIVTSYLWHLPSLKHPNFKQIISDSSSHHNYAELIQDLPTDIHKMTNIIMSKLKEKYMGFCSIDFMLWRGAWAVSEVNTSGVGTGIITKIDKNFPTKFAKGLSSLAIDLSKHNPNIDFPGGIAYVDKKR